MSNQLGVGVSALCVICLAASANAAEGASAALQKLDAARSTLTKAVERIQVDPPANADLDAAAAAVDSLKSAIDSGAEFEQSDLDYAKAALAARKELRTQREYVDQRRSTIKIHDARRAIDPALKALGERMPKLQSKDPAPVDFTDAQVAIDALKKLVDDARPFIKQDQKFATYLADADATVTKSQKALDERQTQIGVERQRVRLDEARQALKTAVGALATGATDEQFKEADRASADLNKRLDEGKALEAKSKPYQAEADKTRGELAVAKKKMDETWSATGLARLKGEIEPAYKDLVAAARVVKSGKASADQLAEARTAAIVVRKLVEKFKPEAERSEAFGKYVEQVKWALADVEGEIERKNLIAAQIEVGKAQRAVEKAGPSDEQFAELNTALTILEKTIAASHDDAPTMEKPLAEANWALREGKKMFAKRRLEVDVERQKAKVEDARKLAADAMNALQQPGFMKEQIQQAESASKLIITVLDQGKPLTEQEKTYAWYDQEVRKRAAEIDAKIAIKQLALTARDARTALSDAANTAKAKIETARAPEGTDADLNAAVQSVEAINKLLETQSGLEKQDGAYAAAAEKSRNNLYGLMERLELAKISRELRKQTGEALAAGSAAVDAGAAEKNLRNRKTQYDKALSQFKSCQSQGTALLTANPALTKLPVLVDGHTNSPREVMAMCSQRADATDALSKEIVPLIKFEDGPKKSYEAGVSLLGKSKKPEALAQFNECVATGLIIAHDYPDMKERKFDVAGGSMTLNAVVQQCVGNRNSIQGKK